MMNFDEYISTKQKLHTYLLNTKIQQKLNLTDKLLDNIEDHLLTKIQFKEYYLKSLLYYIIGFQVGLFYSYFKKLFIFRKRGIKSALDKQVIFISARTLYNRFLNLAAETNNSSVVYMPDLTYDYLDKHIGEHQSKGNCAYVITYSIIDILKIIVFIISLIPLFYNLKNNAKKQEFSKFHLDSLVTVFCLKFIAGLIAIDKKIYNNNTVFIADYDKSIDLLILKHYRERNGLHYKIGSLNHGAFVGFNLSYVRPCADFIMCTCKRETELIEKYSQQNGLKVKAVGAPLQSFSDKPLDIITKTQCKGFLVLGTLVEGEWAIKQRELILALKEKGVEFRYRPRPASKPHDLDALSDVLSMDDCTHNTTLSEDCNSYQNIISFSLDALSTCIRMSRNLLVYVTDAVYNNYSSIGIQTNQIVVTSTLKDVLKFIDGKHTEVGYSGQTKEWIYNNIGEQDFAKVVENIHSFISENS